MNSKPLVYIAGPYSIGHKKMNVFNAMACAEKIIRKGGLPLVPHLSHYWDEKFPKAYGWWCSYDIELLKRCDYLVRLHGESKGADEEVAFAKEMGLKVYTSSEVWHEDFYFPTKQEAKATLQNNHELAGRGTQGLPLFDQCG